MFFIYFHKQTHGSKGEAQDLTGGDWGPGLRELGLRVLQLLPFAEPRSAAQSLDWGKVLVPTPEVLVAPRESWLPGCSGGKSIPLTTHPPSFGEEDILLLQHALQFWFPRQIFQERNIESCRVQSKNGEEVNKWLSSETYTHITYLSSLWENMKSD